MLDNGIADDLRREKPLAYCDPGIRGALVWELKEWVNRCANSRASGQAALGHETLVWSNRKDCEVCGEAWTPGIRFHRVASVSGQPTGSPTRHIKNVPEDSCQRC
jgi:hypothetical protein